MLVDHEEVWDCGDKLGHAIIMCEIKMKRLSREIFLAPDDASFPMLKNYLNNYWFLTSI